MKPESHSMADDFYADREVCQAILMDYYRTPRCAGISVPCTHAAEAQNAECGDVVRLSFLVEDGRVLQARTTGAGCAVSQASASILMEQLQGKTLTEVRRILVQFGKLLAREDCDFEALDRLLSLKLVTANPARVRCAGVARDAAILALAD